MSERLAPANGETASREAGRESSEAQPDDWPPEPATEASRFAIQNRQRAHAVDTSGIAAFLERVADDVAPGDPRGATLRLVSDRNIRELNRRFRQHDKPTDVLAFPSEPEPHGEPPHEDAYLGDMVISAETAARQADASGVPLDHELRTLALHGLLHLYGYDHERDRGEMSRLERLLRQRHGLAMRNEAAANTAVSEAHA